MKKPLTKLEPKSDTTSDVDYSKFYSGEYLPQSPTSYTALSVICIEPGKWILRQTDIINDKIAKIIESKPNARSVIFEYFKMAAADLYYKEH